MSKVAHYEAQESPDYLLRFSIKLRIFTKTPPFENCVTLMGKIIDSHICFESKEEKEE